MNMFEFFSYVLCAYLAIEIYKFLRRRIEKGWYVSTCKICGFSTQSNVSSLVDKVMDEHRRHSHNIGV